MNKVRKEEKINQKDFKTTSSFVTTSKEQNKTN